MPKVSSMTSTSFLKVGMSRNPSSIAALLRIADGRGYRVRDCLAGTQLEPADIGRGHFSADTSQELTIIRNLLRVSGNESGLGIQAGSVGNLGVLGVWGLALPLCQTIRDAIRVALRFGYRKFSWELVAPTIIPCTGGLHIVHETSGLPSDVRAFLIERELAYKLTVISLLADRAISLRVECTLDAHRGSVLAEQFPQHSFEFGCCTDAIILDTDLLNLSLPNADPDGLRLCERQCEILLATRPDRASVAAEVRNSLLQKGPSRASPSAIAAQRFVDPRTLRRQLAAEGTSYRALLDEVRQSVAVELLTTTGLPVDKIAAQVGYTDAASFSRAFKRWTGVSPGSARTALTAAAPEWPSETDTDCPLQPLSPRASAG